jgi:hypothetical protein
MRIYHYTKGISLLSILNDGFIATEKKKGFSNTPHFTDFVWLTESKIFPKTALPLIKNIPGSSLLNHLNIKNLFIDYEEISKVVNGLYRFSFDSSDSRLKKWWFSDERKKISSNLYWLKMENIANKVGDNSRLFWIAKNDLFLEKFNLEVYQNGNWVELLTNTDGKNLKEDEVATADKLILNCMKFNIQHNVPFDQSREAA